MKVIEQYFGKKLKYFLVDGSEGTYVVSEYNGAVKCTCIGYLVHKKCKHIRFF